MMLLGKGLTIRLNLRNDAYHATPRSVFPSETFEDNKADIDMPDTWFRILNPQLHTTEIVCSNEFK